MSKNSENPGDPGQGSYPFRLGFLGPFYLPISRAPLMALTGGHHDTNKKAYQEEEHPFFHLNIFSGFNRTNRTGPNTPLQFFPTYAKLMIYDNYPKRAGFLSFRRTIGHTPFPVLCYFYTAPNTPSL